MQLVVPSTKFFSRIFNLFHEMILISSFPVERIALMRLLLKILVADFNTNFNRVNRLDQASQSKLLSVSKVAFWLFNKVLLSLCRFI